MISIGDAVKAVASQGSGNGRSALETLVECCQFGSCSRSSSAQHTGLAER